MRSMRARVKVQFCIYNPKKPKSLNLLGKDWANWKKELQKGIFKAPKVGYWNAKILELAHEILHDFDIAK